MQIKQINKDTPSLKNFMEREWRKLDIEHYGKPIEWKREDYVLVAQDKNGAIYGYAKFQVEAGVIFLKEILFS